MEKDGIRRFMHLDIRSNQKIRIMKKIFSLAISLLFFANVFAQMTQSFQKKAETKLALVFQVLEESDKIITESQIVKLFDSLDQEEVKKFNKEVKTYRLTEKGDTIYSIGDEAHGGIVFWVDKSGRHGLVVSKEDQASEVTFYKGKTNALKGDSIYAGKFNTKQIITNRSVGYYAAKICSEYKGGGFNDWYLPSKFELNLLYLLYERRIVSNFARDFYWSSSEDVNDVAWLLRFYDGQLYNYPKFGSTAFRVRAIRAF
jgi:hypothetical protein